LEARDDDLPAADFRCAVNRDEVTVQNARIPHAHAADPEQEMRLRLEQIRIELIARLDVFLREDRRTRRHPADERQADLLPDRVLQTDTARRARDQLYGTLALERAQMLLCGVDGLELEPCSNLGAGRRHAGVADSLLDDAENLLLTGGKLTHGRAPVRMSSLMLYTAARYGSSCFRKSNRPSTAVFAIPAARVRTLEPKIPGSDAISARLAPLL